MYIAGYKAISLRVVFFAADLVCSHNCARKELQRRDQKCIFVSGEITSM